MPRRRVVGQYFRCFGFHDLIECAEWEDEGASPDEAMPVLELDDLRLRILLDATRMLVFLMRDRSTYLRKVLTGPQADAVFASYDRKAVPYVATKPDCRCPADVFSTQTDANYLRGVVMLLLSGHQTRARGELHVSHTSHASVRPLLGPAMLAKSGALSIMLLCTGTDSEARMNAVVDLLHGRCSAACSCWAGQPAHSPLAQGWCPPFPHACPPQLDQSCCA